MDTTKRPEVKRGFVMMGGGAKGFYEAGVMHAFHLCGMEFDVITGSSIGAINSIIYAEYLYQKHHTLDPELRDWGLLEQLEAEVQLDKAVQAIDLMDPFFRRFFTAWLQLPSLNIIDDQEDKSPKGALARIKDDVLDLGISIPDLTRLLWWLTTPPRLRGKIGLRMRLTLLKLFWELKERVGGWSQALRMVAGVAANTQTPDQLIDGFLETYLQRVDLAEALVDPDKAEALETFFTQKFTPLRQEHLDGDGRSQQDGEGAEVIFDRERTFADYEELGIDVRLTRANFRTGRLEISAYLEPVDFAIYLANQIWRWEKTPKKGFPLGSHRLHLPGNPNAIAAAMASGRFPGVLAPYPVEKLYPSSDPRNQMLHKILNNWLRDEQVGQELTAAYEEFLKSRPEQERKKESARWQRGFKRWVLADKLREFFPQKGDTYVDGGAIDNTPTNTAIDSIRELAYAQKRSKNDLTLDLYTILLHPEPMLEEVETRHPALHRVVQRTLNIQSAAILTSDANNVAIVNTFGNRGRQLGETLRVLIEAAGELDQDLQAEYLEKVRQVAGEYDEQKYPDKRRRQAHFEALMKGSALEGLRHVDTWSQHVLSERLPLHVDVVDVYPDVMPLGTLQFTERFGYRKHNAVKMITMGCYNALWDLRQHLEERHPDDRDHKDRRALLLARRWMGFEAWPDAPAPDDLEDLRQSWRCQRTECVFHASHCRHGANPPADDRE